VKRPTIDHTLKLTSKMLYAKSADGELVILKRTNRNEVEVLRYLHSNQSMEQTHIIPLLDVIDDRVIVLPLRTPLLLFLRYDASAGDIGELALQFLEGVAQLQHSSVAHLDLKPDNIVVQSDPKLNIGLTIIDFHIAVLANANPTISTSSGTDGWSAPEVLGGKPYDPLLADRWSCGCVLKHLTKHMEPSPLREKLCILSQQLMNTNPSQRPPIPDRLSLCSQEVGALRASLRLHRDGGQKPNRGQPKRSRRLKGLGLQDCASPLLAVMNQTVGPREAC
jgi:serine/threonine protein kinase